MNSRPPVPQTGALTRLRYAPIVSFQWVTLFTPRTTSLLVQALGHRWNCLGTIYIVRLHRGSAPAANGRANAGHAFRLLVGRLRGTRYRPAPYPPRPILEPRLRPRVFCVDAHGFRAGHARFRQGRCDRAASELHGPTVSIAPATMRGVMRPSRPAGRLPRRQRKPPAAIEHASRTTCEDGRAKLDFGYLWRQHPN